MTHKDVIDRKMLYECVESSLTPAFKKTIAVQLPNFNEDGVALLYYVIKETDTSTTLARRDQKLELATLTFKQCGYDVAKVHAQFDATVSLIAQGGKPIDDDDKMMYLLQIYKTVENEQFLSHINQLESQWSTGTLTSPEVLRTKVKQQIATMKRQKTWKPPVRRKPNAETTALAAEQGNRTDNAG